MSLTGNTVRIIAAELQDGKNLFGTIISDRGGKKLLIRLTDPIKGKKFTSDMLELSPINEHETFKPLGQYYSVIVNGALVTEQRQDHDPIITRAIVALD